MTSVLEWLNYMKLTHKKAQTNVTKYAIVSKRVICRRINKIS